MDLRKMQKAFNCLLKEIDGSYKDVLYFSQNCWLSWRKIL